jgi:TRAP-type C4-dicarboxylate transport system substrate-binding protein
MPMFGVDSIPFLATSYGESRNCGGLAAGDRSPPRQAGHEGALRVPWPPQGIFSAKPISSAADLKGVKWRAYNPNTSRIAQLVGAQPVTIQAAELTQALATGAVNTFMTSAATGYDSKVWEQVKYYYDVSAWLPKNLVIVSQKAFDASTSRARKPCSRPPLAAETRGWKVSAEKNNWYIEQLKKNGMKVDAGSAATEGRPEEGRRHDDRRLGEAGRSRWPGRARRLPQVISPTLKCRHGGLSFFEGVAMRTLLDRLPSPPPVTLPDCS